MSPSLNNPDHNHCYQIKSDILNCCQWALVPLSLSCQAEPSCLFPLRDPNMTSNMFLLMGNDKTFMYTDNNSNTSNNNNFICMEPFMQRCNNNNK